MDDSDESPTDPPELYRILYKCDKFLEELKEEYIENPTEPWLLEKIS
jgi:hypothetical protein